MTNETSDTPRTTAAEFELPDTHGARAVLSFVSRNLERELAAVTAERDVLQRFKVYVHKFLDEAGVPVDPPGPHRDAGCRVGQRLTWFAELSDDVSTQKARIAELEAELSRLRVCGLKVVDAMGDVWPEERIAGAARRAEDALEALDAALSPSKEPSDG